MTLAIDGRHTVLAVLVLSAATVAAAWLFQIAGGYVPCPLCLQQRWAYYAVVLITLCLWLGMNGPLRRFTALGLSLSALAMLANAGLGLYHAGIEWQWWPGPQTCSGGAGLTGGLPDLDTAVAIACDEAQWRLLGLSFAGWNIVISIAIAAIAIRGALDHGRTYGSSSVSQ
ncbi:MAG: disulfide bond formation protein B [Pseudomonadota bacterium]|nr:disulfide bond formation protein B [Pseudomonadota bacterium]